MQSEVRMVRADVPNGLARVVLSYNDYSNMLTDAGVLFPSHSVQGLATSPDRGSSWTRHDQQMVAAPGKLQGDPWLAASGPTVVMSGASTMPVNGGGLTTPIVLWISNDGGTTFGSMQMMGDESCAEALAGGTCNDGPRIALTRSGLHALVSSYHGTIARYLVLEINPVQRTVAAVIRSGTLDPPTQQGPGGQTFSSPPNCTGFEVEHHPNVQISDVGHEQPVLYIGMTGTYHHCIGGSEQRRHEGWRSLDMGQTWERVLSVAAGELPKGLLGFNSVTSGDHFTRRSSRPALAVSRHLIAPGGLADEVLLLAAESYDSIPNDPDELARQMIVQYRLSQADQCLASQADKTSCGLPLAATPMDDFFKVGGKPLLGSRKGIYQYHPAYFTGDGTSAYDGRVGIVWYTQPYRGLVAPPADARRTIVEGAVGYRVDVANGRLVYESGKDYGPISNYTLPNGEGPAPLDLIYGQYFLPCPRLDQPEGYFGEYIGGAFKFAAPESPSTLAAWTDSRRNCLGQMNSWTFHQHIYVGSLWF